MKKLFLALTLSLLTFSVKPVTAQWVTIPDSNFVKFLQSKYPSCMNGNLMDTTCNGIIKAKIIDISNKNIADLAGIQYFDLLDSLNCSVNYFLTSIPFLPKKLRKLNSSSCFQLEQLPILPPNLIHLYCSGSGLLSLPPLPNSLTILNCNSSQLISLPPLPLSLVSLRCESNPLVSLPPLPSSLKYLYCGSKLASLQNLPSSLRILSCYACPFTYLPVLPDSLDKLYWHYIPYSVLPSLPSTLTYLECSDNDSLKIISNLPSSLIELVSNGNDNLISISGLPASLKKLYCYANQKLNSLSTLPDSLVELTCSYNQLTSLSNLPSTLNKLDCSYNNITNLPQIPPNLTFLSCTSNKLKYLPYLPSSLRSLFAAVNELTYIPNLPDTLSRLVLNVNYDLKCLPPFKVFLGDEYKHFKVTDRTKINCLPNFIQHPNIIYFDWIDNMRICDLFNTSGCEIGRNIQGTVYKDDNLDCTRQVGELLVFPEKINLYESGNLVESGFFNGNYGFSTKLSTYKIEIDTTNFPFIVSCPLSGDTTITVTTLDSSNYHIDFGLKCKNGFDIASWNIRSTRNIFPGEATSIYCLSGDIVKGIFNASCINGINGAVKIIISGPAKYNIPLPGALTPTVTGDTLVYTIPDFSLVNAKTDFAFSVVTNTTATIGDQVCFEVLVTPTAGDNNPSNNHLTHCFAVSNSFDPNEKEVSPVGYVNYPFNDWLTYTIHFQNTGNDSARHIQILDTLDSNIDARSFELLSYSVMPMVQIKGSDVAFNFVNIMLPDSNHSKEGSKGYVSYRVKPTPNLAPATTIKNKASIYFDFNAPIVTNETVNTIAIPVAVKDYNWSRAVTVYPNPVSDKLQIDKLQIASFRIEIRNLLGQIVIPSLTLPEKGEGTVKSYTLNVSALIPGIYFLSVTTADGNTAIKKFVKQ